MCVYIYNIYIYIYYIILYYIIEINFDYRTSKLYDTWVFYILIYIYTVFCFLHCVYILNPHGILHLNVVSTL